MSDSENKIENKNIPANVWYLGLISFFNDTASEMLYPILPVFFTSVLGAPVYILGIIEGVVEATASIMKTYFGYLSDKLRKRRNFIIIGYGASVLSKVILALSYSWPIAFIGRFTDRFGKGVRTSARDALLLESSNNKNRGLIFGFHRSMDTAGAVLGPLLAIILLNAFDNEIRTVLYVATIPALIVLGLFVFVKESKNKVSEKINFSASVKNLPSNLKIFFLGIALFSLGNSSDTFLLLQAKNIGLSLTAVISAYMVYNLVYALISVPSGFISDKIGQRKVFIFGILIFSLVYLGFAFNKNVFLVWPLFCIYGLYMALTDGIAKALVGSLIEKDNSGTIYGIISTITGLCVLLASIVGGFLWSFVSPSSTFTFGAVCSLLSIPIFLSVRIKKV